MYRTVDKRKDKGVSILTCTKRPDRMYQLLKNYGRQRYSKKELIIILNNRAMDLAQYKKAAAAYSHVRIYQLPDHVTLGHCLNFGVSMSKYPYVAKFDDDDYYAPRYLSESMKAMVRTHADVVGKRAHYMVIRGKKPLLFRYYNQANRFSPLIQGATLIAKRSVFKRVSFPHIDRGECVRFCSDCAAAGFRIYSGSPYNFIAYRRGNSDNHTWKVSDKALLTRNVKLLHVEDVKKFVTR